MSKYILIRKVFLVTEESDDGNGPSPLNDNVHERVLDAIQQAHATNPNDIRMGIGIDDEIEKIATSIAGRREQ